MFFDCFLNLVSRKKNRTRNNWNDFFIGLPLLSLIARRRSSLPEAKTSAVENIKALILLAASRYLNELFFIIKKYY